MGVGVGFLYICGWVLVWVYVCVYVGGSGSFCVWGVRVWVYVFVYVGLCECVLVCVCERVFYCVGCGSLYVCVNECFIVWGVGVCMGDQFSLCGRICRDKWFTVYGHSLSGVCSGAYRCYYRVGCVLGRLGVRNMSHRMCECGYCL